MTTYITTERQATALAEAGDLMTRAAAVGITRKQYHACATLKDARALVEAAERALAPAAPAADAEPVDNSDRIVALQAELAECNQMGRILEIEAALKGYGVELVDESEAVKQ